nr:hypothetical protein [Tanacetum cinerariifolium]
MAYGAVPDSLDEYLQMDAATARDSLQIFYKVIKNLYGKEFLRKPTYTDMKKLYVHHNENDGFPGMLGSIDCTAILSGADNRPPMLEKDMYDSWKSRMELYMLNRQHDIMILESVEQGPLIWTSVEVEGVTRLKKYSKLSVAEAIQADCDVKATNIILQGLPPEVYALVSTHKALPPEIYALERECKLYDAFDKFAYQKGETLRDFYLRFSLLLNDMNMYNMKLEQFQVNIKFLNTLPPEWSKFVTDVKLVRDLYTTNQQASTYQTSPYATSYHTPQFVSQGPSSSNQSISYPVTDTSSIVNHNAYMASSLAPHIDYAPMVQNSSDYSPPETGLLVLIVMNSTLQRLPSWQTCLIKALIIWQRELALEKQVKELNNIVFKRVQTDEPNLFATTTIVEVLKELPKVSMVNSCLKKLKFHLASFDMVVKERTTTTAIMEGT